MKENLNSWCKEKNIKPIRNIEGAVINSDYQGYKICYCVKFINKFNTFPKYHLGNFWAFNKNYLFTTN